MSKTCAEVAADFVKHIYKYNQFFTFELLRDEFKACSDFPKPKKKQVWQWRYKIDREDNWSISIALMEDFTLDVSDRMWSFEKHAGPFEVEE